MNPKSKNMEKVVLAYLIFSLGMTAWLAAHLLREIRNG
jgi:hypothetical protein